MERKQAYELIQKHALRAHRGEVDFREAILNDPEITSRLSRETILKSFDLKPKYVDYVFDRVERATRKYGVSLLPACRGKTSPEERLEKIKEKELRRCRRLQKRYLKESEGSSGHSGISLFNFYARLEEWLKTPEDED